MAGPDRRENRLFVGRERELAELRGLVTKHRAVLVCGDAGVGKTTLVERALYDANVPDTLVVSMRGAVGLRDVLERIAFAVGSPRPYSRSQGVEGAILQLVDARPRTFVLDEADDADVREAGPVLRSFLERRGASRVVIVCRVPLSADEAGVKIPAMRVGPLDDASARELVSALERVHGDLTGKLVRACGANPGLLELALRADALSVPAAGAAVAVAAREATTAGHAEILGLLAAAESALDEAALVGELGAGARRALGDLALRGLVRRAAGRVELVPLAGRAVARTLDASYLEGHAVSARVLSVARAWLEASSHPDALAVAVLAAARAGKPQDAIALLRQHGRAASRLPQARLAELAMDALSADPVVGRALLALLAREQLRSGNYEELDATLERFADDTSVAMRLVRADAFLRRGRPKEAERELEGLERTREVRPALAVILAMKGDTSGARKLLAKDVAASEGKGAASRSRRLAVARAATQLFDDDGEGALEALEPARGDAMPAIVTLIHMVALLLLDRLRDAEAVLERVGKHTGLAEPLTVAVGARAGRARAVLPTASAVLAAFDPESDVVYRVFFLRCAHEAALAAGDFVAAEGFLAQMESLTTRPGLERLADMARVERGRHLVALGELSRGRALLRDVSARLPSARVAIEARSGPPEGTPRARVKGPLESLEALTDARRALEAGDARAARTSANAAREAYARAGVEHLRAEACVLAAEAATLLGKADEAAQRLDELEALAREHGYDALAVSALLVRAALARAAGDLAVVSLVAESARRASRIVQDASLVAAARVFGLRPTSLARRDAGPARPVPVGAPFASRVSRLGLDAPVAVVFHAGSRTWLLPPDAASPLPRATLVDARIGAVVAGRKTVAMPAQRLGVLEALAEAGPAGLDLEALHASLHRGASYHPLRHRNALYVALNRTRDALRSEGLGELKRSRADRYVLEGEWLTSRAAAAAELSRLEAHVDETAADIAAVTGCGLGVASWLVAVRREA